MLGLIGEYIGRIYISLNKSPQFIVREVVNGGGDVPERKVCNDDILHII